jgi:polyisoprenoid-binding protein YceI
MKSRFLPWGLVFTVWLIVNVNANANPLTISAENSELIFSGEHAGMAFEGKFERWQATLVLPPSIDPKITATFDLSSAKTGDRTYDSTLPEGDWFDVETHPQGSFVATTISASSNGFWVEGELTLKGITKSNRFELIGSLEKGFKANIVVNRLDFVIGLESDPDADWVSKDIQLQMSIPSQ